MKSDAVFYAVVFHSVQFKILKLARLSEEKNGDFNDNDDIHGKNQIHHGSKSKN